MSQSDRPNLLLIMTDQHRGDCLGCDGHPVLETPFLDDLAGKGTRFTAAYSAVPSCIPARATLMTGMDQWHTGVLGMGRSGSSMTTAYAHTLPGELAAAGYHTQGIGKMHFSPQRALLGFHNILLDESSREQTPGFKSDYRRWFEENKTERYGYHDHAVDWNSWMARPTHLPEHLHPTWWTAQQSIDWLDRRDPTKPFFLKTSFARPHSPYDAPQVYYDMYKDRDLPQPYIGDWADCNDIGCDDVNAWRTRRSPEQLHRARACYYGNVTFIDHQIGRLLYELRMRDPQAYRNTFVIFTSDHGDMLGDHHLWRKTYGYEGSARIPFIIRPPLDWDCPRGQALDQVVELRDVMPTFLQAAGLPIPETVDGLSALPLVAPNRVGGSVSDPQPWRTHILGEHDWCYSHEQANYYLTDGRWKYMWFPYLGKEQLFDRAADPGEEHDLSGDAGAAEELKRWRQVMVEELSERECGLVEGGELVMVPQDQAIKSPHLHQYGCDAE